MIRFGSLFSGIGGLDLGLERAGMSVCWQVERDSFCQSVLRKHWPSVPLHDDVTTFAKEEQHGIPAVDLIAGGFPCQDVSYSGKRGGIAPGTRSGLWHEYARIVRVLQPQMVLVENVPGLLSLGFGTVLGDLSEMGYNAEWGVIPASSIGAPHKRQRVFVFAHRYRSGGARLVPSANPGAAGPWGWRGEEDLQLVSSTPFERGDRWPQPLLRRVDARVPNRVDRLRAVGNSVSPHVGEWVGRWMLKFLEDRER